MARKHLKRPSASLTPLITVTIAATVFTILLVLVLLRWQPLESTDHQVAVRLNALVAPHPMLVTVVRDVTSLGSSPVLGAVVAVAAIYLLIRRRWRLTLYLIATAAGAFVLDPVIKALVGRLRPVVAHPVAHGIGNSFPSGHSLDSIVCYGALLLVFLPATRGRWRTTFISVVVALVALIGISRILLGVHFVSDVIAGWAVGIAWLGVTAVAFELARQAAGQPLTAPATEGLAPEERAELKLAHPEDGTSQVARRSAAGPGRIAAEVVATWVLIVGVIAGVGELVVSRGGGNLLGDRTVPRWFAAHRTPGLTHLSTIFTMLGATKAILAVTVIACAVTLAVTRRWRPVIFLVVVMVGELGAFLIAAGVTGRPRPPVTHLDGHAPPTSSYPSGHTAATTCIYIAIAILVIGQARGWWRWLFLVPAIAMPILVATSRMYRGEHHPTDVAGSLLLAALWLTATTLLIQPNAARPAEPEPAGPEPTRRAPASLESRWGRGDSSPRPRQPASLSGPQRRGPGRPARPG
jgi:membrane-associated phospholipid phosphatase